MNLYEQTIKQLESEGSATVIPFKVISFSSNESHHKSEFEYDESLVGWLLGVWAKRSVANSDSNISFKLKANKLTVFKNF